MFNPETGNYWIPYVVVDVAHDSTGVGSRQSAASGAGDDVAPGSDRGLAGRAGVPFSEKTGYSRTDIVRSAIANQVRATGRFRVRIDPSVTKKAKIESRNHDIPVQKLRDVIKRGEVATIDRGYYEYQLPSSSGTYEVGGRWIELGKYSTFRIEHAFNRPYYRGPH